MSEKPAAPKRRRLAVSLRLLLILVAIFAVWAGRVVNKARNQQRAVAAIRRAGGYVVYDYEHQYGYKDGKTVLLKVPPGPAWKDDAMGWLRDRLGPDYIHDVACVVIRGPSGSDLAPLAEFGGLRDLSISSDADVTDEGLVHLRGLKRLECLSIEGKRVTDSGLAHLAGLSRLQSLSLRNCSITGSGLAALEGLPELRVLQLEGNPITDGGLEYAEGLTRLRSLGLAKCPVGNAGLTSLARLPELQWVCLNVTLVDREHAAELRRSRPRASDHPPEW